jgi:hypothetical protein
MSVTLKRVFRDAVQSLTGFQVGTRAVPINVISANGTLQHPQLAELVGSGATTLHTHNLTTATPITCVAATGTLTFTGVVSNGETVTIGNEVYEFVTTGEPTEGNHLVDVSGGVTATQAVTALYSSIESNSYIVSAVDGEGDTVVITAVNAGTAGNDIATATTCVNASFAKAKLDGGVNGTAGVAGQIRYDASYIYICTAHDGDATTWKKASLN